MAAASKSSFATPQWWKESTIYQVYPSSFKSTSSGNIPGWGDIKGITSKLDYLQNLGVDIVWSSPIYKSPQFDMGYDISDYKDIDPRYGTLENVDELIQGLKKRGMKLMMDLVVNHTSSEHEWFKQSRSSKQNPKRDWYIWQAPKYAADGTRQPPNNWAMILGDTHSAWTWDEETQEYYLSLFTSAQPDLNWRNPDVRAAVHDILRFWLDRGASGFRMDVINLISKVEGYPDAEIIDPDLPYQPGNKYFANGPHLHEYLHEINQKVLSKYDTITVGEMPFVSDDREILKVVGADRKELNMIFIFDICDIDRGPSGLRWSEHNWTVKEMRDIISRWQNVMREGNGWNSVFFENHDNPRAVSRYTDDSTETKRQLGAKLLALLQTTLPGTLYIYQGQELGMKNVPLEWPAEEYKDIESQNFWNDILQRYPHDEAKQLHAKQLLQAKARDHARTPVQWDDSPNAGFCAKDIQPWMRVNDDYQTCNAEAQVGKEGSVYSFFQACLARRKAEVGSLVYGRFTLLDAATRVTKTGKGTEDVIAYTLGPVQGGEEFVVVLNFSGEEVEWDVPKDLAVEGWVVTNYGDAEEGKVEQGKCVLRPWEGVLGRLKG